jgi:predicted ATPase/DNA-binding SARP family transcriptional activator
MSLLCRITLMGEFSVQQDQRHITRFRTQKAASLLAFLAYHAHRSHPREHLLELLWPQLDPFAGRSNLSFVLSSLRNQLEPPGVATGTVLVADRNSVRLNPTSITTDVTDFEAGLKAVAETSAETEQVQRLEAALALYRGPLLPGNYEDWIAPERQRLADRYVNAARQLIRALAQDGELPRALDQAQRAVTIDPLRESLHADLMRLYVAAGQVSRALQQYEALERLLKQELGAKPEAATRDLVSEIRSHQQQAQRQPGPYEEQDSPLPVPETETLLTVGIDRSPARGASVIPTPSPRRAEEPTAVPTGTVTLLLAQALHALDDHEKRSRSSTGPQVDAPTMPTADTHVGVQWGRESPTPGREPDANPLTLARVSALLRRELGRHRGHPFQRSRLGHAVAFQSVGEALSCAIAVQRNLSAACDPDEHHSGPGVCMALHTGDVEPGSEGFKGRVLEQTRRLLEAGHPGQILCSEASATLLRRDLQPGERLIDQGLFRLRDVPTPEHLFEVEYPGKLPLECPPLRAEAGYTAHLPLPLTRFFGREEILTHLHSLLLEPNTRLLTLTGTGGMGKTRLAVEAARRVVEAFDGAVWFVPLADVRADTGLLSALVEALGLPRASRIEPLEQVCERLSGQRSLLVLDNFEHLVEAEAARVSLLLERVPTLTCLVTSRQRLALGGEQELVVPPLPVPERGVGSRVWGVVQEPRSASEPQRQEPGPQSADPNTRHPTPNTLLTIPTVALFVDRAQAVKPDFQVTVGNAEALARLCEGLEGIPLAVELAASRAQVLTPAQMLSQLQDRFGLLVSRRRDVSARHRTLRSALDWSYHLLSPELQQFLCRLSVFRGGFSLEAVEGVCEEELALDYLAQLRECSLILAEDNGEQVRYGMLETLREYAREKLEESGHVKETLDRHLEYFLALAEEAEPRLTGSEQAMWLQRLETEHDNLRAVLMWCLKVEDADKEVRLSASFAEIGMRLTGALWRFWYVRGHYREGREWTRRALERKGAQAGTSARSKTLYGGGALARSQGDYAGALALFEESLALLRQQDNRRGIAALLNGMGVVACEQGDNARARDLWEESLIVCRELGERQMLASALTNLGIVTFEQGDYAASWSLHQESLTICTEFGDRRGIALARTNLGNVASRQCNYPEAQALYKESLSIYQELGERSGVGLALQNLGRVACDLREYVAAQAHYEASLSISKDLDDRHGVANTLNGLGEVASAQGEHAVARPLYEKSLSAFRQMEDRRGIATVLNNLGHLSALQNAFAVAQPLFEESLGVFREIQDRWGVAAVLHNLGDIAWAQGEYEAARPLYAESVAIRRALRERRVLAFSLEAVAKMLIAQAEVPKAVRLWGAACTLRESLSATLPAQEQTKIDRQLVQARLDMGEGAFAVTWEEGRALTWEQAVDYALEQARQFRR